MAPAPMRRPATRYLNGLPAAKIYVRLPVAQCLSYEFRDGSQRFRRAAPLSPPAREPLPFNLANFVLDTYGHMRQTSLLTQLN